MTENQEKITKMSINGVNYVLADSVREVAKRPDGLTYCIVRCRMAGVVSGWVNFDSSTKDGFDVYDARQLYRWNSAFVLADLAESGVNKSANCKFSEPNHKQRVFDPYQLFECTEESARSIQDEPNANR